jgi:uncharacterized protein YkwD
MKPRSKRMLSILLIITLITATPMLHTTSFAAAFGDVNGHWAETYIDTIKPLGVINGYPDGTFRPDNDVTRIQFISITINALDKVTRAPMANEYWGTPYVEVALDLGLIAESEFGGLTIASLDSEITREEMASIVVNAFYSTGATLSQQAIEAAAKELNDFNKVSPDYYNQAVAAVALDIMTGYPDDTFGPLKNASRAQAAAVSHKLLVELGTLEAISEKPDTPQTPALRSYAIDGIQIGDSYESVIKASGTPVREDTSEYGFKWLIYHDQYRDYHQVGIQNGKVVALFTASDLLTSKNGLKTGMTKSQVDALLGKPMNGILKGSYEFLQYNNAETATYLNQDTYITAYYDTADGGKLFGVKLVDYTVEQAFKSQYGTPSDALRIAMEKQIFDLLNVYRVSFDKPVLKWNENLANVARKHSKDMAVRDFFSHTNPSGYDPFDRIVADGIDYMLAAENIAAGYTNAFSAHNGWVNSPGHRLNLLRDIQEVGIGVYLGGNLFNYYTQNFITQ